MEEARQHGVVPLMQTLPQENAISGGQEGLRAQVQRGRGGDIWVWTVVPHTGSPQPVTCTRVSVNYTATNHPSEETQVPRRDLKGREGAAGGLTGSLHCLLPRALGSIVPILQGRKLREEGEEMARETDKHGSSRTRKPRVPSIPPSTVGPPALFLPL